MCDFYLANKQLFEKLDTFIDSIEIKNNSLIQVLHHAQSIFGYLPKEVLEKDLRETFNPEEVKRFMKKGWEI